MAAALFLLLSFMLSSLLLSLSLSLSFPLLEAEPEYVVLLSLAAEVAVLTVVFI